MDEKKRTLDDNIRDRERLEKRYWKKSNELTDEFERLLKECDKKLDCD